MAASGLFHVDVAEILADREKAFLVRTECGKEVWLPKAAVSEAAKYEKGDRNCTLSIPESLAKSKGFEVEDS